MHALHNKGGTYSVIKLRKDSNLEYVTVIPDAGTNREFAISLVDMLNSQGSQAGEQAADNRGGNVYDS